jgi:two-component system nitrate/nitrite response regulator NarL
VVGERSSGLAVSLSQPCPLRRPVRVVAAARYPLFRDALARAVGDDPRLAVIAEVDDVDALCGAVHGMRPDVVIGDADLLACLLSGPAASRTRTLLLADAVAPSEAFAAVERGARGYLSKDSDGTAIRRAIDAVARGETVLDPAAQSGVAREIRLRTRDERPELSPREQEILVHVAAGRTAPEIARELVLSTATVKTHLMSLYFKLGVKERAAAVAEGMRRGLLE